jgi:Na+/H+ antiporter NhaC
MWVAERRAAHHGHLLAPGDTPLADYQSRDLEPPDGIPHRALNAVIPIATVVGVTLFGLIHTGSAALDAGPSEMGLFPWVREVFANGDSYSALLWASLSGVVLGVVLPIAQRLLSLRDAMTGVMEGFKSMLLAMVVLVLAWSIGAVCGELHTAEWLVRITEGVLSPHWLPALVFILSAFVAFATGTSWGSMGILMPLVIPLVHGISTQAGYLPGSPHYTTFLVGTVSSVLAGTVWGDHCSPISDTTILSSMASGSDHIAHVRTQLPYALGLGVLGVLVGDLPTAYGLPVGVSLLVGTAVIIGGVMWLGKRTADEG